MTPGSADPIGALDLNLLPALIGLGLAVLALAPMVDWLADRGFARDGLLGTALAGRALRWLILAAFLRWPGDLIARSLRSPQPAGELWPSVLIVGSALLGCLACRGPGRLTDPRRSEA